MCPAVILKVRANAAARRLGMTARMHRHEGEERAARYIAGSVVTDVVGGAQVLG